MSHPQEISRFSLRMLLVAWADARRAAKPARRPDWMLSHSGGTSSSSMPAMAKSAWSFSFIGPGNMFPDPEVG